MESKEAITWKRRTDPLAAPEARLVQRPGNGSPVWGEAAWANETTAGRSDRASCSIEAFAISAASSAMLSSAGVSCSTSPGSELMTRPPDQGEIYLIKDR
jgi:hypothetical protein